MLRHALPNQRSDVRCALLAPSRCPSDQSHCPPDIADRLVLPDQLSLAQRFACPLVDRPASASRRTIRKSSDRHRGFRGIVHKSLPRVSRESRPPAMAQPTTPPPRIVRSNSSCSKPPPHPDSPTNTQPLTRHGLQTNPQTPHNPPTPNNHPPTVRRIFLDNHHPLTTQRRPNNNNSAPPPQPIAISAVSALTRTATHPSQTLLFQQPRWHTGRMAELHQRYPLADASHLDPRLPRPHRATCPTCDKIKARNTTNHHKKPTSAPYICKRQPETSPHTTRQHTQAHSPKHHTFPGHVGTSGRRQIHAHC